MRHTVKGDYFATILEPINEGCMSQNLICEEGNSKQSAHTLGKLTAGCHSPCPCDSLILRFDNDRSFESKQPWLFFRSAKIDYVMLDG
jgi:hypothetical protein